jgi:hypothetical protein
VNGDLVTLHPAQRALINPAARKADQATDFSTLIRAGRSGFGK